MTACIGCEHGRQAQQVILNWLLMYNEQDAMQQHGLLAAAVGQLKATEGFQQLACNAAIHHPLQQAATPSWVNLGTGIDAAANNRSPQSVNGK
jgi:hypothetical protein